MVKVLISCASFAPNYGGPAHSVSQLAIAVAGGGHEVGLWAPDGSAVTSPLVKSAPGLIPLSGSATRALEVFGRPDCIHDNGIWLAHNRALAEAARRRNLRRIISPRGMLDPWALRHKKWKKRLALSIYQRNDLNSAGGLHATSESEGRHIRDFVPGVPVTIVPNGIHLPDIKSAAARPNEQGVKTALFVGRIHPVKGLDLLIEAWARVRPTGWRLEIVGPDEADHQAHLERIIVSNGLESLVSFSGLAAGDAKAEAFRRADLFVLPSHMESFGMALGEALAYQLPALITKGVPWPEVVTEGFGWQVDTTVTGLEAGLRAVTALDRAELRIKGARGRHFVESRFS